MTLLENLPPSYEYLITALETLPMQDLTMEFVTARLMHEVSKRREKEPQGDDVAMVSMQGKGGTTFTRKDNKDMLLLWQTRPHYTILLQGQEQQQGEGECQQSQGR
jgi:hypothetical protein